MKLKAGTWYKQRNGGKAYVAAADETKEVAAVGWNSSNYFDGWSISGQRANCKFETSFDLIAEWVEPVAELNWLYAAIEGRTKGAWSIDYIYTALRFYRKSGCDVADQPWYKPELEYPTTDDAPFIATMGTVADEIADVLRAAELVADLHSFDRHMALKKALAALAAACNTSGGMGNE